MSSNGTTEDRLAIRELLERYAEGVNQRDPDVWGSTWAEDSVWNLPVIPGMEEVKGRKNIVDGWLSAMESFPFIHMMAYLGTMRFEGDRCYMRSYTSEVAQTADGQLLRPVGQYDDVVVKHNGQWLFEKRKFQSLHGE